VKNGWIITFCCTENRHSTERKRSTRLIGKSSLSVNHWITINKVLYWYLTDGEKSPPITSSPPSYLF
jgi:hypothetical protein